MLARCADPPEISREADQLVHLSRLLGRRCGFERSFKISPDHLDTRRFLISAALGDVSRSTLDPMFDALRSIALPAAFEDEIRHRISAAAFIHFGYEEGQAGPTCKIYLEFDPGRSGADARLVHSSFKWEPRRTGRYTVDDYLALPPCGGPEIQDKIEAVSAALSPDDWRFAKAYRLLRDFILARRAERDLYVLDVGRRNGGRASIDVRLYELGCRLGDLTLLALPLVPRTYDGAFAECLAVHESEELGHVALGTGNNGRAFLTVYFGARELR